MGTRMPANGNPDAAGLRDDLAAAGIDVTEGGDPQYESSYLGFRGRAAFVVRPRSTEEVALALGRARARGITVVPQGANTGLVGAGTPDDSGRQVVLSLLALDAPVSIDPVNRSATVGAGVRLATLNRALSGQGLMFPVDLAVDPSIGGMIATNAGGTRVIRYGDTRRNVLGLEAVLSDGTVVDMLDSVRKNNVGLDVKQMFIGAGGATGVVTRAVLDVRPLPRSRCTALVSFAEFEQVVPLLLALEQAFPETLSSFEGLSGEAVACAMRQHADYAALFEDGVPQYCALVEVATASEDGSLSQRLSDVLTEHRRRGRIRRAVTPADRAWPLRRVVSDCIKAWGPVLAFDVSLPRAALAPFRRELAAWLRDEHPETLLCDFGHIANGGMHIALLLPGHSDANRLAGIALRKNVYDKVVLGHGGSFSSEHGIGPLNRAFYERYAKPGCGRISADVQRMLNPGPTLGRVRFG